MLDLPPPDTRRLAKAPLALVICQLQFGDRAQVDDPRIGVRLKDLISGLLGDEVSLERTQTSDVMIALGQGGLAQPPPDMMDVGFRVIHPALTVSLGTGALALETTAYTEWSEFSLWLGAILELVRQDLAPPAESRLGLRMINKLHDRDKFKQPDHFREWIRDWLLMPTVEPGISPGLIGFQQQCDLRAQGDHRITLRSALFHDREHGERLTFLLDYDAYRSGYRILDLEDIRATADNLNTLILQLFHHSITPTCYQEHADGNDSD